VMNFCSIVRSISVPCARFAPPRLLDLPGATTGFVGTSTGAPGTGTGVVRAFEEGADGPVAASVNCLVDLNMTVPRSSISTLVGELLIDLFKRARIPSRVH